MPPSGVPSLIIQVVGYHSIEFLPSCFEAIGRQTLNKYHVIYINNSSGDGSSGWVAENAPGTLVLESPLSRGYAGGHNVGIRATWEWGAEWYLFLNPDVYLAPNCLERLLAVADSRCGLYQPLLLYPDGAIQTSGNKLHYLGFGCSGKALHSPNARQVEIAYPSGAALLVSRRVIEKIGPFLEDLHLYHEDLEFGLRARLAGFSAWTVPDARAIHAHDFAGRTQNKFFMLERNRWFLLGLLLNLQEFVVLLPLLLSAEAAVVLLAFRQGWLKRKLWAAMDAVRLLPSIRRSRRLWRRFQTHPWPVLWPVMSDHLDFPQEALHEKAANCISRVCHTLLRVILWKDTRGQGSGTGRRTH